MSSRSVVRPTMVPFKPLSRPGPQSGLIPGEVAGDGEVYMRNMTRLFGNDGIIDNSELNNPDGMQKYRDWHGIDEKFRGQSIYNLSKMATAMLANIQNGAHAIVTLGTGVIYTHQRYWRQFFKDWILVDLPDISPTGIPPTISWVSEVETGRTSQVAVRVEIPNEVLEIETIGWENLIDMLSGAWATMVFTIQARTERALAYAPYQNLIRYTTKRRNEDFTYVQLFEHLTRYFGQGAINPEAFLQTCSQTLTKFPRKDTLVVCEGTEWALTKYLAENRAFTARIRDITRDGATGIANGFAEMQIFPESTVRLPVAEDVAVLKCAALRNVGGQPDETCEQPLHRQVVLSYATVFPRLDRIKTNLGKRNMMTVATLSMRRGFSERMSTDLANVLEETLVGGVFASADEAGPSPWFADIIRTLNGRDGMAGKFHENDTHYAKPDPEAREAVQNAEKYDELKTFRAVPWGITTNADGSKFKMARRIGELHYNQLPYDLLREYAENADSVTGGMIRMATVGGAGGDNIHSAAKMLLRFAAELPSLSKIKGAAPRDKDITELDTESARERHGEYDDKEIAEDEEAARKFARRHEIGDGEAMRSSAAPTSTYFDVLERLANASPLGATVTNTLRERLRASLGNPQHTAAHVRNAITALKSMGLTRGHADPDVPLPAITEDQVDAFVTSIPSASELASAAPLGTRINTKGKLAAEKGKTDANAKALLDAVLAQIHPSHYAKFKAHLQPLVNSPHANPRIVYAAAYLMDILVTPLTVQNIVHLMRNGLPIVSATTERWNMRLTLASWLVMKRGQETIETLLSPTVATITSRGLRRITDFGFGFHIGHKINDYDAIVELPCVFPVRIEGGMSTTRYATAKELRLLMTRDSRQLGDASIVLPVPITEERVDYDNVDLFGYYHGNRLDEIYRKTTAHTLFRLAVGDSTLTQLRDFMLTDLEKLGRGMTTFAFGPIVNRDSARYYHGGSPSSFDYESGTGPLQHPLFSNHRDAVSLLNGVQMAARVEISA